MAAARALRRHLDTALPGAYELGVHDLSAHVRVRGRPLSQLATKMYSSSVAKFSGNGYAQLYRYADRHPAAISRLAWRLFGRETRSWLLRQDAAVVITTHPLATQLAVTALRDKGTAVICLVTDAGRVNRLWWEAGPDVALVTYPDLVAQAPLGAGSPGQRTVNIGLIADPALGGGESPAAARRRIGLDEGFTVLLSAGGLGYGPNLRLLAQRLSRLAPRPDVRFLIATGANEALRSSIMQDLAPWSPVICPKDGMTDMLLAADLVVGKAGWLTVSECVIAGRPIVVVDQVPGQEDENVKLIESLGIGRRMSVEQAADAIGRYAADPARLRGEFTVRRDLHDPQIGLRLGEIIENAVQRRSAAVVSPPDLRTLTGPTGPADAKHQPLPQNEQTKQEEQDKQDAPVKMSLPEVTQISGDVLPG